MPDLSHTIGGDASWSATGDLLLAEGLTLGQQRVLRRLITNPLAYLWHPEYGAGLPALVGQPKADAAIKSLITTQMFLEETVLRDPAPTINVTPISAGMFVEIQYFESDSGQPVTLSYTV